METACFISGTSIPRWWRIAKSSPGAIALVAPPAPAPAAAARSCKPRRDLVRPQISEIKFEIPPETRKPGMEIRRGVKLTLRLQREPALDEFSYPQISFLTFQQSADSIFTSLRCVP